jgi:hypothetical protein
MAFLIVLALFGAAWLLAGPFGVVIILGGLVVALLVMSM